MRQNYDMDILNIEFGCHDEILVGFDPVTVINPFSALFFLSGFTQDLWDLGFRIQLDGGVEYKLEPVSAVLGGVLHALYHEG